MKIGILYIATGKYSCFWQEFYESSEKFLFPGHEKHYFAFTDSPEIQGDNVTVIHRECQGFPADTLFRFDMFLSIKEQLQQMDYLFFLNSNIVFKDQVGDEIIPGEEHNFLVAGLNPAESIRHYSPLLFRYERNKKSLAYIAPHTKGKYHYFLGGLNGGRTPEYLKMCETLAHNIRIDYDNGIVAIYHDESHINRYFRDYPPLALGKEFGVFEGWNMDIKCKLIFRDKTKVSDSFKKNKVDPFSKVIRFCRRIWSGIKWNLWL